MKKMILLLFVSLILVSCSFHTSKQSTGEISGNENFTNDASAQYNLYIGLLGNVGYIQIKAIKDGRIDYGKPYVFDLKKKGKNVSSISSDGEKVYASIYNDKKRMDGLGNQVAVLQHNHLVKNIKFPKNYGLDKMMIDKAKNKGYVMCAVQPSRYNPLGTPIVTFNTQTGKPLETLHIKGILGGYAIKGRNIYLAVFGAKKTGYDDVPDQYIARLNRDSGKIHVITATNTEQPNLSIRDFTASSDQFFLLTGSENGIGKLSVYHLNGTFIKNFPLKDNPSHLALNNKGMLYISHVGPDYHGQDVTVFDTHTGKIVQTINGFNGAGAMQIEDHYLFVDNEGNSSVTVVDMNTNRIIGTINLGLNVGSHGLVVLKN